ncbi:MAG TPA: YidC/Oxa1 family membrane protein insertase [Candidatus Paceibacterota bacterium]|nr:YidC/Oxa1 family membrane protein insertase [Candidatus Paceibacterota bacterium]
MGYLYSTILYRPLLNALVFLYNTIGAHDLGLAIVFLTIIIRIVLFPVFHKSARQQVIMQKLQPEMKRIQELHKKDREKQTKAIMDLHKEHGVNPFMGFLLLLVQLPILWTLYIIIRATLAPGAIAGLYGFVAAPASINPMFLGLINLSQRSIVIVGLAAVAQYLQAKLSLRTLPKDQVLSQAEKMSRQMVFLAPILTVTLFYGLPAAIPLYWCVTSFFSAGQQVIINKQLADADGTVGTNNKKNS